MSAASGPANEAQQAGVLVWGQVAAKLARALIPLLIVRLMGQGDVGLLATMILVYETISVLLVAGLPRALLYLLAGRPVVERAQIARRFAKLGVGAGIACATLLLLAGGLAAPALTGLSTWLWGGAGIEGARMESFRLVMELLPWIAAYAVFDIPARLTPNLLLAEGRARGSALVALVGSVLQTVGTLVPAALQLGVAAILLGQLLSGVVAFGLLLWALRSLYPAPQPPLELGGSPASTAADSATAAPVTMREILAVSMPLGATDIVITLNGSVDRWLIALFFTRFEVAEYEMGAWQIPVVGNIAYAVGAVYMARLTVLVRDGQHARALEIWRASIGRVSLVVVPVSMVFLVGAPEFVEGVFTATYVAAWPVFACYVLLTMARVTAFGSLLVAAGRASDVLRASAASLACNVAISLPLVWWLGFYGPALGTVLAFVPTVWIYCRYIARAFDVPVRQTFALTAWLRVVAVATPGALLALFTARTLTTAGWDGTWTLFLAKAVLVLLTFAVLGTVTRIITLADWRYLRDWVGMRVLRG